MRADCSSKSRSRPWRRGCARAAARAPLVFLDPAPAQRSARRRFSNWWTSQRRTRTRPASLPACAPGRVNAAEAVALGQRIRELGARSVIVKLGDQGCVYCGPDGTFAVPSFPVRAVDSTAAGDTFNAALAVALAEGAGMEDALRFANAAAAISVTRPGAQTSAPERAEVEALLGRD